MKDVEILPESDGFCKRPKADRGYLDGTGAETGSPND